MQCSCSYWEFSCSSCAESLPGNRKKVLLPLAQLVVIPSLAFGISGVIAAIALIVIVRDWRVTIPALLMHYVCLAAVIGHVGEPNVAWSGQPANSFALVLPLAGISACLVLGITMFELHGHQAGKERRVARRLGITPDMAPVQSEDDSGHQSNVQEYLLRILALAIAGIGTYAASRVYPLVGNLPLDVTLYWLVLSGLMVLIFGRDLLAIGLGLLVALSSVILLQSVSPQAATIVSAVASSAVIILVAFVVAYLCALLHQKSGGYSLEELRRG